MKKILVAGAGLVVRPLVRYLLDQPDFRVEVGDIATGRAEAIVGAHPRGSAVFLDIQDEVSLKKKVAENDLVVSMVPYSFHPILGRISIEAGKPMVTASYVSPAMRALDADARSKGVIILNELGLDPGIDHMEAMRVIHAVKGRGGMILGFTSWCGGLPAPEANTNPFGYKFSWSPKGVLLAGKNSARFLQDGQIIVIPAEKLFEKTRTIAIPGHGEFEAYPNRDSVPYAEAYGIPETKTMLRGTLRYPGWCATMKKIGDLGLLDASERNFEGLTWAAFVRELAHAERGEEVRKAVARTLNLMPDSPVVARMSWLGLFSETLIRAGRSTALDVLTDLMTERLKYAEGERDMIILRHEFLAAWPEGKMERISSTLVDFGVPGGDSSMSRTVGLPAAIGARFILEGRIRETGVRTPILPAIYEPILDELGRFGVRFSEERQEAS